PLAGLLFTGIYVFEGWGRISQVSDDEELIKWIISGLVTWAFVILYTLLTWRGFVRWTRWRRTWTILAAGAAGVWGLGIGMAIASRSRIAVGAFFGSASTPLLWLLFSMIVWRETKYERNLQVSAPVCPRC